jgi:hypothetical protein
MEPSLMESRIKSSGRLRSRHLPAVYLDPSFFAAYVAAAMRERAAEQAVPSTLPASISESQLAAFDELRRRTQAGSLGLTLVLTGLTLTRWMQDMAPHYLSRDVASRHAGALEDADFEGLRFQGWLSGLLGDALEGLLQVDLSGFALTLETAWEVVPGLALLDGSSRSTVHALAARHLGCTHLATLADEMARICEVLRPGEGPSPLLGAKAVLRAAPPPITVPLTDLEPAT